MLCRALIVTLILAAGCLRTDGGTLFWPRVSPEVDSLMTQLDDNRHASDVTLDSLCRTLEALRLDGKLAPVVAWRAKFWRANVAAKRDDLAGAIKLLKEAEMMVDKKTYPYDYHRIDDLKKLFANTQETAIYQKYVDCYNAIQFYRDIQDYRIVADNYNYMGITLSMLDEHILALENFKKAENYYARANTQLERKGIQLNIADCYYYLGDTSNAKALLQALESDAMVRQHTTFYTSVLSSMCDVYRRTGDNRDALIEKIDSLLKDNPNAISKVLSLINIGDYHLDRHQPQLAVESYESVLAMLSPSGYKSPQGVTCMKSLATCYDTMGRHDDALKYYALYVTYNDSLRQLNPVASMQKMESLASIRQFEERLRLEKEQQRSRLMIAVVLLVTLITIAIILTVNKFNKEKIKRQLQEAENRSLALQLENGRLKAEEQQLEIELRNRQLMERTLVISEKENALKNLRRLIAETGDKQLIDQSELKRIGAELGMHIDTSNEWEFFRKAFEEINPSFYNKLTELVPTITDNEKRLCAYLSIGLPRKQIAFMLNVQPDSIKKAVTRLRKKLHIPPETTLEQFLATI